jgi:predicted RNA-binding protein YlxR (DUF448 family)
MIRIAAQEGKVVADPEGRALGRGGYLHRDVECVRKFAASKAKELRSLKIRLDRPERLRISEEIGRLLDRAAKDAYNNIDGPKTHQNSRQ